MFASILHGLAGVALLYLGGEMLVRGAIALAFRLGVSVLAIGLTVVSFGTSAPELMVALNAAVRGTNDVAVGSVVGSNVANIGLILALATLIRPAAINRKILRIDLPIMVSSAGALLWILGTGSIQRWHGIILLIALGAFVYLTFSHAQRRPDVYHPELIATPPEKNGDKGRAVLLTVAGCVALAVGGHLLVDAAVAIATQTGVSQAVIGLTVVAVGTSLPELAASIVAAARGHADIAIGNIVGSNIFNTLGILGTTAVVTPLVPGGISWSVLWFMLAFSMGLYLLMFIGKRLTRLKGAVLLMAYLYYLGSLVY